MTNKLKTFETTFNKYTIIKNIGEGGSGRVFNVVDEDNNNLALKILSPDKITNEKRKRFKNEINFCFKNKHPNIIKVLDFGFNLIDKKNCPFYVMSYYPETLRTLIDKKIDHNKILIIFSSILDGIEAAHIKNIYHRDLKPENILYNPTNNEIVIADFGIAYFNEDYLLTKIETDPRSKLANLRYSSPEQRIKGEIINQKSDIYSLGLILHEIFTNEVPQGTGYTKIININPNYSYLDIIIEKMIQQKQNNRYNSIEEIKKDLIAYKNEFIAFQELDKKKSEVIKKVDIEDFEDIKPIEVDYKNNSLIFTLDKEPNPK